MPSLEEIETQLQGPGALFEVGREEVLGRPLGVFVQRMPSLRAVPESSAAHGDKDFFLSNVDFTGLCFHYFQKTTSISRETAFRCFCCFVGDLTTCPF